MRAPSFGGSDPTLIAGEVSAAEILIEHKIPTHIGRYLVLKSIGEGGMGLVFAAYDPELDRKVAVKLVRPGYGDDLQRRLLREAQALAKLSHHPNIIHVYEVGALRDSVFLAMEYFEGQTLKLWQDRSEVSRREILAAYRAAGRGLEAAHAAGLVHRDFKAENVLIGADKQIRVIDFGLAREESTSSIDMNPGDSIKALTMTGTIMGTPAYMAPEQHAGGKVDPRTDQFSFCVSLYEALYGERPFAGQTIGELTDNVMKGTVQPPPRFQSVPPWIRRALLRGLSVDPEQRFPTIGDLLAELGHDRAIRRRRVASGVVVAGLLIAGALFAWERASQAQRARAEGDRLRAEFGRARTSNAEEELHRLRTRTTKQRWDDLVIAWANERVEDDPTRALASLRQLQDLDANLGAARTIAADAWHRGVARESIDLPGKILELDVAPTGDFAASLAAGGLVQGWHRGSSKRLSWDCPEPATSLAVSPHAPIVAVGGKSGTIFLVELGTGRVQSFAAHEGSVDALTFSADGRALASGGADRAVRRWTVSGHRIESMTNHDAPVVALRHDLGGTAVVSGTITGELAWWDIETAKVRKVDAHDGPVESLAAAQGIVWSVGSDGVVSRWTPGSLPRKINISGVASLQVMRDGGVVFVHRDGSVTWSDGDFTVPPHPLHVGASVTHVAHAAESGSIWLAGPDIGVQRWDATSDYARTVPFEGMVAALNFSPDGSLLAIAGAMGLLEIVGMREASSNKTQLGNRPVRASFSPSGDQLAIQLLDGGITILDPRAPESASAAFASENGAELLDRSEGAPHPGLAWTDDGSALAFAQCTVETWCGVALLDVGTSTLRGPAAQLDFVSTLDPNDDGTSILVGRRDVPTVLVLDVATGETVETNFAEEAERVLGQAWSDEGDGRVRIATASGDTLSVWSWLPTSKQRHRVLDEPGFSQLQPNEDATAVYLDSDDRMAVLWSIAGTRFLPVPELPEGVERIRLSDDGRTMLARGEDDGDEFAFVVDLEIGHGRRLPRLIDPVALSIDGVVADHRYGSGVRIWAEPTPEDAAGFRAWLEQATTIDVALDDFRE